MLWMDVDAALAEVPVNAMPLVDADLAIQASVAYNAAGLTLVWNFVTAAGAQTQTAVTPTNTGNYLWTAQGNGVYSIQMPASGGGTINNDAKGYGWFSGVATGILPWKGPTIGFRAAGLNDLLVESAYSTTRGLAGTALPAVAAEAAGGLYTRGTGAGQINQETNGRVDVNVHAAAGTAWGSGAITAASIAADAITDAKVASDVTIASVTGAVGSVTGAVGSVTGAVGSVTGSVGSVATGGITTASFAAGAINAAAIGADAITDAKVASDVTIASVTGAVGSVTGNVGGNVVGSVASVTAGVTVTTNNDKTGYGLSGAAVQAIWDALTSALTTVGSIGKLLVDNINATISSRLASASYTTPPTVGQIADQVWEETLADHSGTSGSTAAALNAAGSAGDPWNTALPGAYGSGTAGKIIGDNINATISSRATPAQVNTEADTALADVGLTTTITGRIDAAISTRLADASYTAPPSAATNASAVRTELGTELGRIDATVSSRATPAQVNTEADTALSDVGLTTTITGRIDAAVSSRLATAGYTAPPSAATNASAVRTELGVELARVDAAVSTRATPAEVNAEVVDALNVDTYAEPTGAPPATASLVRKIGQNYKHLRNEVTQTSTTQTLKNDGGTTDITATVSDDATTFTRGEWG